MRQRARLVGPAPDADRRGAGHVDIEVGARVGGHAHAFGSAQHFGGGAHAFFQRQIRHHALQRFGMLVGDIRIRAPAFSISGVSTACISPSTVQSTTKPACCNAVTTGAEPLDRLAGAGGADRHDLAVARRRHHDVKRPCAHSQQRQFGEMHVERARLGLRKDRRGVAGLDRAALENLAERVDPFRLDAICQHGFLRKSLFYRSSLRERNDEAIRSSC